MEIKINGTRLKLERVFSKNSSGNITISRDLLKYKKIITEKCIIDISSSTVVDLSSLPQLQSTEGFVIREIPVKDKYSHVYTEEELVVIKKIIISLCMDYKLSGIVEIICNSIGDGELMRLYYNNLMDLKLFRDVIRDRKFIIDNAFKTPLISTSKNRYSVKKLLEDLVNDDCSILLDSQLVGNYSRMSSFIPSQHGIKVDNSLWCKITSIVGNKSRANLSLNIKCPIKVQVPENTFGISSELDSSIIKTVCVVKDGTLHTPLLAVKVSKRLSRVLKSVPDLVEGNLIRTGEYLLNLSKIPVISKSELYPQSALSLFKLETELMEESIRLTYLQLLNNVGITEEEEFLKSIGIIKGVYTPPPTTSDIVKVEKYYDYLSMEYLTINRPFNKNELKKKIEEYKRLKFNGNRYLTNILNDVNTADIKVSLSNSQERYNYLIGRIRDTMFRVIMSGGIVSHNKRLTNISKRVWPIDCSSEIIGNWSIKKRIINVAKYEGGK